MITSEILVRPIVTEKVNAQMEKENRYTFAVKKQANKLEIKNAVEEYYNVKVQSVRTSVVPAKNKSRFTKNGYVKGQKSSYKKAVVSLVEGDSIDLFAF